MGSKDSGRVVLITGAAGGIGSVLVEQFLDNGDVVIATDLPAADLACLAVGRGPKLRTFVADLSLEDAENSPRNSLGRLQAPRRLLQRSPLAGSSTPQRTSAEAGYEPRRSGWSGVPAGLSGREFHEQSDRQCRRGPKRVTRANESTTMTLERFSLAGRTAVVTGAAVGLGQAFATALIEAGADVACVDRDRSRRERGNAGQSGGRAHPRLAGARRRSRQQCGDCDGARADARGRPCRLGSRNRREPTERVPATLALLPTLMRSKAPSIISVSSFLGLVGVYPDFAVTAVPYAASKAALVGFTRQAAVEYAREGVRANAIAPGWHGGTQLGREFRAKATAEHMARFEHFITSSVPMGRRGTPEELTGLLLYLASDASSYVTGQIFAHAGGVTAA